MNQQAASSQQIEQLWYTWSDRGLESALAAGYRVRACSPGLSSGGRLDQMRPYLRYQLPADAKVSSLSLEEAPRALALVKIGSERILLHKVYAGRDGAGRPGNYFVHLLAGLEPAFSADWAICFWRYRDELLWRTSDDPGHGLTLPPIPYEELKRRLARRWQAAFSSEVVPQGPDFILLSESERRAALDFLPLLLLAFFDQQERADSLQAQNEAAKTASQLKRGGHEVLAGEGQAESGLSPICLVATPDQAAWLVWALAQLLPPSLRQRLTFSTYEDSGDLSDSRAIRRAFALVATCPARAEHAATWLSERFHREAWIFNLFTGLHTAPRELPEAQDFAELVSGAFRGGELGLIEQLHRDLEGTYSDIHSFLQGYKRWRNNQNVLTPEAIVEIIRHHPADWSQLMVRRQLLQLLCESQQGEMLLDRLLADLRALAVQRRQDRRLDQGLVRFENEARDLWRRGELSTAARVRLLLTLEALETEPGLLGELVAGLLNDPAAQRLLQERPDRCTTVLACAARVLARRESERYREVVGRLLSAYRDWESCRSLLSLTLPAAWRGELLRLLRRVLASLTPVGVAMPSLFREGDWRQLRRLLGQAQGGAERDDALALAGLLLRNPMAPAFDLLTICCQLSPPPTEGELGELLGDSALLKELSELELWRVGQDYLQKRLQSYANGLRQYAQLYLQTRLPTLEELCLRLFTLFCYSFSSSREELLRLLFSQASDALRERLLLVWPPTSVRAVADLIWECARKGDPFFLRTRIGLFFYQQVVQGKFKHEEKLRLLNTWLERQPDPLDLQMLLVSSQLAPDEIAWLLKSYGPSFLTVPAYAQCRQLHVLARRYLEALDLKELRQPETSRLLEVLATPRIALPDDLVRLAQYWRSVARALMERKETPDLARALDGLWTLLESGRYHVLYKTLANELKLSKRQKKKKGNVVSTRYTLEELKPEGLPARRWGRWPWPFPWRPRLRRRF
ncbi:hypothetical protein [Thermogemmatispora sp.]|uniref:GAP1-N2 domain-containing protein n=1 Tax=Thermogemmatispora sp. TaxID=1968838 RepID=UPI0035E44230